MSFPHVLPHACVPALHEMPHAVPSHVATPFAGVGHGEQKRPHAAVEVFATQSGPHA